MARQFVVVALVLFAVVGFACAALPAESPKGAPDKTHVGPLVAPAADVKTGNTDGAAAPGSAAAGASSGPAESPKSGASAVKLSAVAAVASVAGFFFF